MPRLGFLIVDDDPLMLALLEPRLRDVKLGDAVGVRTFTSPDQALAFLRAARDAPRVVLTDFNLKADMNGLDLLASVARSHPETLRILMSGYSREQIGVSGAAPIHGFVEKDLRAEDILRNLHAVLQQAAVARPEAAAPSVPAPSAPAPSAPAPAKPAPMAAAPDPRDVFDRFVHHTDDFALIALDPHGIVRTWNPGGERIKGWKANEIIGRHFSAFYTPGDVAAHKPYYVLQRAAEEGRFEDEGWRIRKDGTMFWANAVVTAIRDDGGELLGFVKVTRDLTARRHVEESVRQSEERYRLFIESVKDYAMFILDTTGHVMTWNEGAQRLKGYRPEEIVGKHFSVFYAKEDRARQHPQEELTIALREGRYEEEGWRVRKDASTFWASVTITALYDADRRHLGFAKVTRDLTERKRAEEGLRTRADAFAQLNRELDAFSHSVAHDLRAPLRAIRSLSERVVEQAGAKLDADAVASLKAIGTSTEQMGVLIQDLLDLSLATRHELDRVDIDLSELVDAILEEKKVLYPGRTIHAQIESGVHAFADARLVRVALANLLDNSLKFTRGKEAYIEFGREPDEQGGAYYLRDHGVGFPPEKADRLFQPFVRLHSGQDFPGTGIGLSIVERIVRRHGGRISAGSSETTGTTFCFTLGERPRAQADVKAVTTA